MRRRKTAAVARSDSSAEPARRGEKREKETRGGQSPPHADVPGGAGWFINYSSSATQRYDEMEPPLRRSRIVSSQPPRT